MCSVVVGCMPTSGQSYHRCRASQIWARTASGVNACNNIVYGSMVPG